MSDTLPFQTFCIESYKHHKNLSGSEVVNIFNLHGVLQYLDRFYEELHSYGQEYLMEDIDCFLKKTINRTSKTIEMSHVRRSLQITPLSIVPKSVIMFS